MKIIIRFLLRNIKEKKFRTFLIVFSIILSTALLFASLSISTTVEDMQIKRLKKYYGSADIMIYPDDDSTSQFLSSKKANKYIDKTDYIIGTFIGSARYRYNNLENIAANLHGYNFGELQTMNPINIEEKDKLMPFTGKKIIIGRDTARKYNLSLGSTINLTINGYKHHYTVSAIASAQGIFGSSQGGQNIIAVVPKNKLTTLYNAIGKNTRIYIKPGSNVEVESLIKNLSREYKRYMVTRTITEEEISEYTGRTTTPFFIMLLLVIFVSIFIIYTSFKVITMERLPVIGTFRSIGATKKITDLILLSESIIYGVLGGIVGLGLGFIILYYMMRTLSYNPYSETSLEVEMIFTTSQILLSFFFSIILSISGSIIPIIKVSKFSIKDIVLNNFNNYIKPDNKKNIIGLILLLTAIVLPYIAVSKIAMLFYLTSIILIGIVIVLLIPIITNLFIFGFEKIYKYIFGNEGILAVKNLRGNKNILNNIVLLSLGISSVLLINIISYSVGMSTSSAFKDADFDIWLQHPKANRRVQSRVKAIYGVQNTLSVYEADDVKLVNYDHYVRAIFGVDPEKYFDYWDFNIIGDKEEIIEKLDKGRNIIIGTMLQKKYNIKIGDSIVLETQRGNRAYKVIGFVNTFYQGGDTAFASEKYMKRDMGLDYGFDVYIRTFTKPEELIDDIKKKFSRENIWVSTVVEVRKKRAQNNVQLFTLLKGFSIITMIIGVFGVFNNFIISFMSRKRTMAVFRSIGMSKKQNIKMVFIETITVGIIGGVVGILGTILFINVVDFILIDMSLDVPMVYTKMMFLNALISGVIISVIASISPALKTSNLNIVEAIKYE